jgi:glycosyltransferase involved in cell wall biosynthesis
LVVHNGVRDVDAALRARPEQEPVRLCSVARFAAPKDHRTLLCALALLRSRPWELDLIGDGPELADRRKQADQLGLSGRVHFHGYLSDPAPMLRRAHIFVLSSLSEAFPRSVLEAMRAGLPVVASDVGGVAESVTHGVSGLLLPARNPSALAEALANLLDDPALRGAMGRSARAVYENRFRLECMVDSTAAIYDRLLK